MNDVMFICVNIKSPLMDIMLSPINIKSYTDGCYVFPQKNNIPQGWTPCRRPFCPFHTKFLPLNRPVCYFHMMRDALPTAVLPPSLKVSSLKQGLFATFSQGWKPCRRGKERAIFQAPLSFISSFRKGSPAMNSLEKRDLFLAVILQALPVA